jgi:putative transposase
MLAPNRYVGHRFPPEIISHAVWLYFRFPLSLRMAEEMLAARGIVVSHEAVRQWALKFGQGFANEASLSVIITRGARPCRFRSLRSSRLAAFAGRRRAAPG